MPHISKFEEVRADGKIIPAKMTNDQWLSSGWEPCKVVVLRWLYDGTSIEFRPHGSVLGTLVPGDAFVAAIVNDEHSDASDRLVILCPNGSEHGAVENRVSFMGSGRDGHWSWFEPPMNARADVFGAVFQSRFDGDFLCDVDAATTRVLAVRRTR